MLEKMGSGAPKHPTALTDPATRDFRLFRLRRLPSMHLGVGTLPAGDASLGSRASSLPTNFVETAKGERDEGVASPWSS
jgi:hypothetical protein